MNSEVSYVLQKGHDHRVLLHPRVTLGLVGDGEHPSIVPKDEKVTLTMRADKIVTRVMYAAELS